MSSILPDIWELAQEHRLGDYRNVPGRADERRFNCPFCQDTHHHLYLNAVKKVFKCYRCGSSGGVAEFAALLTGTSALAVLEDLRQQSQAQIKRGKWQQRRHPAENLTTYQLKAMDLATRINWYELKQRERQYARRTMDWLWAEWQGFLYWELRSAYKFLILGIATGCYQEAIEIVVQRARVIGYDLLTPVLAVRADAIPEWATEGFLLAQLYLQPEKSIPVAGDNNCGTA